MRMIYFANSTARPLPGEKETQLEGAVSFHMNRCLACLFITVVFGLWQQEIVAHETKRTIGPVTTIVTLMPEKPVIGDTLQLTIEVTAEKDVEVLMPEFGEALRQLQIIDFSPKERLSASGESIFTQSYKLRSPPSGEHFVPPILIEFIDRRPGEQESPDGEDAYTLETDRINFTVASVVVADAAAELRPPLLDTIDRSLVDDDLTFPIWTYLGVAVGTLLFGAAATYLFRLYQRKAMLKSAYEIAKRKLDRLVDKKLPEIGRVGEFYVELTRVIRQYLENRFELRAPDLTTEEFLETVADSAELSNDHKKLLREFLRHADLVKFAGVEPSENDINESVSKATTFLNETSQNSPLMFDPEQSSRRSEVPEATHSPVSKSMANSEVRNG